MRAWTLLACLALLLLPLSVAQGCAPPCDGRDNRDNAGPPDDLFRHIAFQRDGDVIRNITVDDRIVLDALHAPPGEWHAKRGQGAMLTGDGWSLSLHDNPTGLITIRGNATFTFEFPASEMTQHGTSWQVQYRGFAGLVTGDAQERDGHLVLEGEGRFHIRPAREAPQDPEVRRDVQQDVRREVRKHVQEAIEKRRVLADVSVRDDIEVLRYEDVDVQVTRGTATPADPLRIRVESELDEGKTIILDVDPALVAGGADLHYYDLFDDGSRTEVVFRQADGLEDILDATDDGGQPEYWLVEDAEGVQILVSIPHWSAHEITVASLGEFLVQPSVLVGIAAGVGGVVIASAVMLRPRRE